MEVSFYDTANERTNVNHDDPIDLPDDWSLKVRKCNQYYGSCSVVANYSNTTMNQNSKGAYTFTLPDQVGYYNLQLRDASDAYALSTNFDIEEEPFFTLSSRDVAPGETVSIYVYNSSGELYDPTWGLDNANILEVHSNVGQGVQVIAAADGKSMSGIAISMNNPSTGIYTFIAPMAAGDYYVGFKQTSNNQVSITYDSDSFDVVAGRAIPEEDSSELPDVLDPGISDGDACDPGETGPNCEDYDETEDESTDSEESEDSDDDSELGHSCDPGEYGTECEYTHTPGSEGICIYNTEYDSFESRESMEDHFIYMHDGHCTYTEEVPDLDSDSDITDEDGNGIDDEIDHKYGDDEEEEEIEDEDSNKIDTTHCYSKDGSSTLTCEEISIEMNKCVYKLNSNTGKYYCYINGYANKSYYEKESEEKVEENTSDDSSNCILTPGKAYKANGYPTVYYITDDCTKKAFTKPNKFFTYFDSWDDVKVTTKTRLNSIPTDQHKFMGWGPKWNTQYGAFVKTLGDPKVYVLLGGERKWIKDAATFEALYGKDAWGKIEDVDRRLLEKYTLGGEIDYTDRHPNMTVVKYENDPKVYIIKADPSNPNKQKKHHISNPDVFNKLQYRWDRIVTIPDSEEYETGEALK